MLDARFVREHVDSVREGLKKRGYEFPLAEFLAIDEKRMVVMRETEELRNIRNVVSEEIGIMKRQKTDASARLEEMKAVAETIKSLDENLKALEDETRTLLLTIPNIPHDSVPVGKDETKNVEIRRWGSPSVFDFEPLNHWDIAETLDIIDFDRASKITGARFALMKGIGARLERALMNFMLDLNTAKGYKEVFPPILVNRESMTGTGQLPKFEMELFRIADPEFYLIPTAEVPVTNIHRDEIFKEGDLPILYTASLAPC